ncbi:MAG: ATP-binding cassette domain-containing protein [Flavobacteriales bacterium]|nr:ATP-binding cassette domain-containing protein [Flavobacteriales bacterium]MCB9363621.1 ATP-binding cassette domain-containing protein [Flavobacteriales bacterium]
MTNRLEVDGVFLEFGVKRVLQNIYLKCETGKVTGLLGKNGAGKTCLLKILFGTLIPNDKSIRINETSLVSSYRSPKDIKYLPQTKLIPISLSVRRVFKDFELNFRDFTAFFPEFKHLYNSKLSVLSGGERRVIEIYSILVSPSKFCMLDEPFSQIMPIQIETIKKLIIREKENKGIIITDHLYNHIIDLSDDVYVLSDGKTYFARGINDLEILKYTPHHH